MKAYRRRCTVCNLGHAELLDTAHIILEEIDSPMLQHGIEEMKGRSLTLPRVVAERQGRGSKEGKIGERV